MVLTGAGISVSCGIPDFRSAEGIYAQLKTSAYAEELEDPQQMWASITSLGISYRSSLHNRFDLHFFRKHPSVF